MRTIEHRPTPYVDRRLGAQTEPALVFIGFYTQREQQPVTRCRQTDALDSGGEGAAPVLGKALSLESRFKQPIHLGERDIDRHRDIDAALLDLRNELQLRRKRAIRLGLGGHDPRLRLDSDGQREGSAVNARLGGEGSRRAKRRRSGRRWKFFPTANTYPRFPPN